MGPLISRQGEAQMAEIGGGVLGEGAARPFPTSYEVWGVL